MTDTSTINSKKYEALQFIDKIVLVFDNVHVNEHE